MAKIIKYEIKSGKELLPAKIKCNTQSDFDANYPIAEKEAVGEIIVEGEFDPEPASTSEPITWDELDSAYINGINSL